MAVSIRCPSPKWLLVLGSGICFLVADGCTYSFGIFYTKLSEVFGDQYGSVMVALLSGMLYGLPQISGPLVCPLIEVLGDARSCLLGCMCLCVSFVVTSQVKSFIGIMLTIGLVTSVGLELLYATGLSVVLRHFRRHRGLATGLTVFGGGIGTLLFAEIYAVLEWRYTWRGAVLVEAAIFCHTALSACLYRLLEGRCERSVDSGTDSAMGRIGQELIVIDSSTSTAPRLASHVGEQRSLEREWAARQASCDVTVEERRVLAGDDPIRPYETTSKAPSKQELVLEIGSPSYSNEVAAKERRSWRTMVTEFSQGLRSSFMSMLDPILWRGPFVHFRIISMLTGMLVLQPWIFIHSYAVDMGTKSSMANHILSVMGIAYAVGQILFGVLADRVNAYMLYGVCLLLCGLACLLIGFCSAIGGLIALGAIFGMAMGGTLALYSLVIVDMVSEARLYAALGVFLPFVGIGNLIGGPGSALLIQVTSYRTMFMIGGGGLLALTALFAPLMIRPLRQFKFGAVGPIRQQA